MRPFVKIDSRLPSTRAEVTRARKMLDRADPRRRSPRFSRGRGLDGTEQVSVRRLAGTVRGDD